MKGANSLSGEQGIYPAVQGREAMDQGKNARIVKKREARLTRELIELPAFPDDIRSELEQRLNAKIEPNRHIDMELRLAAWIYLGQARDDGKTERSARRKRVRAMAKGLASTLAAHEAIEGDDLHAIVSASPDADLEDFLDLADQLRKWTPVFQELAKEMLPKGNEDNDRLVGCCRRLIHLYEQVTGTSATHSTLDKKGIDTGEPQSPAGRFVASFFRHVDPALGPRVNEALRKIIWPSRAQKRFRAKSQ